MAERRKQGPGSPAEARALVEEWGKVAKVSSGIIVSLDYGHVLVEGRGKLDITRTVIAIPIQTMMQTCANLLAGVAAPMLAHLPITPLGQPLPPASEHPVTLGDMPKGD